MNIFATKALTDFKPSLQLSRILRSLILEIALLLSFYCDRVFLEFRPGRRLNTTPMICSPQEATFLFNISQVKSVEALNWQRFQRSVL